MLMALWQGINLVWWQGYLHKLNETFFLVAQMELIQTIFVMTTIENLQVHQMDVKIDFLNGNILEEIHMQQLEG